MCISYSFKPCTTRQRTALMVHVEPACLNQSKVLVRAREQYGRAIWSQCQQPDFLTATMSYAKPRPPPVQLFYIKTFLKAPRSWLWVKSSTWCLTRELRLPFLPSDVWLLVALIPRDFQRLWKSVAHWAFRLPGLGLWPPDKWENNLPDQVRLYTSHL